MLNPIDFLLAFLLAFLIIMIAAGLSFLIGKILHPQKHLSLFWSVFSGLFLMVAAFAIVKTKGITLLLPLPFLIGYLQHQLAISESQEYRGKKKILVFASLTFIIQFLIYVLFISYSPNGDVKYIAGDFSIYYRAAEYLNHTGIEANQYSLLPKMQGALTPYHYGDLWFYGFVRQITFSNPSFVFLVSFTVLSFVFTIGLYEFATTIFAKHLEGRQGYLYALIFAGLFTGFRIFFPFFVLPGADPYILAIFNWGKVLVLSTTLIGLVLLLGKGNERVLCTMAIISGLLYINSIPTIFSALFLLLLIRVIRKEIAFKNFVLYVIGFGVCTGLYMIMIYKGVPAIFQVVKSGSDNKSTLDFFKSAKYFKTAFNIFAGGFFQLFTLLPYFILIAAGLWISVPKPKIKSLFTQKADVAIFLGLLFVSGLFCWAAMFPISVDTVQFFHNILAPVYAIGISFGFLFLVYQVKKPLLNILMIVCLAASVIICSTGDLFYIAHFDKTEWRELDQFVKDKKQTPFFVNFQSLGKYGYWSSKKTDMYIPLTVLSYKWNLYHNIALMAPFVPTDPSHIYIAEESNDLKSSAFSQYYFVQNRNQSADSTIIIKFIRENQAQFITRSSDTVLPFYLKSMVTDSLVLKNAETVVYKIN